MNRTSATVHRPAMRLLVLASAWLILLALLTGGYISAAMTGRIAADPGETVAAHLSALLGSFWMLGVAFTLPYVSFGSTGQRRLAWTLVIANYTNWIVTAVKARLHVKGIALGSPIANDIVFVTLTLLVVIPSLLAAVAWIVGLHRGLANDT